MANEKNRKRIVKIVALVIVVVMLLSVFSGIFLIFITEHKAKQNELAMQKAIAELQAESDNG